LVVLKTNGDIENSSRKFSQRQQSREHSGAVGRVPSPSADIRDFEVTTFGPQASESPELHGGRAEGSRAQHGSRQLIGFR